MHFTSIGAAFKFSRDHNNVDRECGTLIVGVVAAAVAVGKKGVEPICRALVDYQPSYLLMVPDT
jgi:hypothetical protein